MKVWATIGGKLWGSENGGDRWKIMLDKPNLQWIAADTKTPTRFYVSGDEGVYQTENGRDFVSIKGPKKAGRMAVDGLGRIYLAAFKQAPNKETGLWRTNPAGKKWARLNEENMIGNVAIDPSDPNRVAFITDDQPFHDELRATGVWLSEDAGATWRQENAGLPVLRGEVIAIDPHDTERIVVGTAGRGFWIARCPK